MFTPPRMVGGFSSFLVEQCLKFRAGRAASFVGAAWCSPTWDGLVWDQLDLNPVCLRSSVHLL
jgi:hypothetical protein